MPNPIMDSPGWARVRQFCDPGGLQKAVNLSGVHPRQIHGVFGAPLEPESASFDHPGSFHDGFWLLLVRDCIAIGVFSRSFYGLVPGLRKRRKRTGLELSKTLSDQTGLELTHSTSHYA